MAARTAFQRRSSSAVEIGVCSRSLSPLPAIVASQIVVSFHNTLTAWNNSPAPGMKNIFARFADSPPSIRLFV
jgi:hypothetical protein